MSHNELHETAKALVAPGRSSASTSTYRPAFPASCSLRAASAKTNSAARSGTYTPAMEHEAAVA